MRGGGVVVTGPALTAALLLVIWWQRREIARLNRECDLCRRLLGQARYRRDAFVGVEL